METQRVVAARGGTATAEDQVGAAEAKVELAGSKVAMEGMAAARVAEMAAGKAWVSDPPPVPAPPPLQQTPTC